MDVLEKQFIFYRWFTHFLHRRALAVYQILTEGNSWRRVAFAILTASHGLTVCAETSTQLGNVQVVFGGGEKEV